MTTSETGGGCACCGPATRADSVDAVALALSASDGADPSMVCSLEGGADAIRQRIGDWQQVIGQAAGRRPADGGVTLTYAHDPMLAVELVRLAAAEYACCSFFTFSLTVGPPGMWFTVTAPDEARDLVTAMFGPAIPVPARGN
jgi:hypothetical protein